jgi:hypothetical protein
MLPHGDKTQEPAMYDPTFVVLRDVLQAAIADDASINLADILLAHGISPADARVLTEAGLRCAHWAQGGTSKRFAEAVEEYAAHHHGIDLHAFEPADAFDIVASYDGARAMRKHPAKFTLPLVAD